MRAQRSRLTLSLLTAGLLLSAGCEGWDPREPFTHNAPEVDAAIGDLKASQLDAAASKLEGYLGTGECKKGEDGKGTLGLPDSVRARPDASFDLGLTLFRLAESFGKPFGDEDPPADPSAPKAEEDPKDAERSARIDCALILLKAIASDTKVPTELRARAHYLAGNLEFLRKKYEEAIKSYDEALRLVPGVPEDAKGDGLGRDVANNRAIAQRRQQEQKPPDPPPEDKKDQEQDKKDQEQDKKDQEQDKKDQEQDKKDQEQDKKDQEQDKKDQEQDKKDQEQDKKDQEQDKKDPAPSEPEAANAAPKQQDDRILDSLEQAPSYQQEQAKQDAERRQRPTMEDK